VGQVDLGPLLLEQVHQPVPAIGGFDDHLRALARLGDLCGDFDRVVGKPDAAQLFAFGTHTHDDRAPAVQVDTDVLLWLHKGFPPLS
jgi:hypothetical protein